MAILDTGGRTRLTGLRWRPVAAVASAYGVAIVQPAEGVRQPSTGVWLLLHVDSTGALATDVHVQVSASPTFGTTVHDSVLTGRADGAHHLLVTGLADQTTYYARVRAAEAGTTGWGAWTPTRTFVVDTKVGRAIQYVDVNVGAEVGRGQPQAVQTVDLNVGYRRRPDDRGTQYVDLNVGSPRILTRHGVHYVDLSEVSTNQPIPRIWFLLPSRGGPGDGIDIYGWGFGELQATFDGRAEYWDPMVREWIPLPVTSWVVYPAGPDAYTADRRISAFDGIVTPQHQVVGITIPATALPPGYQVRIVTKE